MIPLSSINVQPKSWQKQLAQAITDPLRLIEYLNLPIQLHESIKNAGELFPLKVTLDYLDCIKKSDVTDPLLRQILPIQDEFIIKAGYNHDPVGDLESSYQPGLIHKYHGRVLLITTPACAIHCRYCFRRHYPYKDASANGKYLDQALTYIFENEDINEIILSGGDPLSLSDQQLLEMIQRIEKISHIKTLRIHTRLPIVLPDRITKDLINMLTSTHLNTVVVVHCNHPNEISDKVTHALTCLKLSGITLLNQSVLLAGVNDDENTLIALSHKLFEAGVLPYYLHLLDAVEGATHFSVDTPKALKLIKSIQAKLSGFLVPKLVREVKGELYKQNITQ